MCLVGEKNRHHLCLYPTHAMAGIRHPLERAKCEINLGESVCVSCSPAIFPSVVEF